MILFKTNVNIYGVQPELVLSVLLINQVFLKHNQNMIITSMIDGVHNLGSLHPKGFAIDIRTRDIFKPILDRIIQELKENYDDQLDIILESDHLHIEFDPKIKEFQEVKKD